ncbi:hypothetical protein RAA17_09740 [Komagataeibacter rhaeticus]|nr:hypothetical protein [Komagataeibacter rhaeticus]
MGGHGERRRIAGQPVLLMGRPSHSSPAPVTEPAGGTGFGAACYAIVITGVVRGAWERQEAAVGGDQASVGQGTYGRRPLMVMGGLFFVIGFVTWLNGPLITFVQVAFGLGPVGAFLVPLCFYLSYLVCAFPAMAVARWTGLRGGISLALAIMAGGTLLFGECVGRLWYPGALGGLSVLGAGLTLLQVTVNPYVTLLGAPGRAAGRIAIMGIANKVSGIIAPVVFSLLVMPDIGGVVARLAAAVDGGQRAGVLAAFARAVVVPYRGLALALLLAAVGLRHAGLPALCLPAPRMPAAMRRMPVRAWVGVGIVFIYVGVEVMAGMALACMGAEWGFRWEACGS